MERKEKNRIITISGEPVSGKGTTIKSIISKLKANGIHEENIHLISTGEIFRKYRNIIENVINIVWTGDDKAASELSKIPEFQRLMKYSEFEKEITKIVADLKKSNKALDTFSITDFNQDQRFAGVRDIVDETVDGDIASLGKELETNYYPNEIWIIDSRMAFYNIPDSFSVRLTANSKIAGERLFNDNKRGVEDKYTSLEEAINEREERRTSEIKRYFEKYGVDISDESNFDVVIDTSYSTVEDIADAIVRCEECKNSKQYFPKKWASPKIFLPLQTEESTLDVSVPGADNLIELSKKIKENGYRLSEPIDVIEVDNKFYIIEGHHRNYAAVFAGKTLIPAEIIAKDDEILGIYGRNTARQRTENIETGILFGHEAILEQGLRRENPKANFSYNEIYPGIYKEIKEKSAKRQSQNNSSPDGR